MTQLETLSPREYRRYKKKISKMANKPKKPIGAVIAGFTSSAAWYWLIKPLTIVCAICYAGHYVTVSYIEPARWHVTDAMAATAARLAGKELAQGDGLPSVTAVPGFNVDWNNPCYGAALVLAKQYHVPQNVVVNIIHTESRGKPDAINQNTNGTQDHGCMQLNDKFHAKRFNSPGDMYIAARNVEAGIQFLKELYKENRNWNEVATMYHSRTDSKRQRYKQALVISSKITGAGMDVQALNNLMQEVY